MASNSPGSLGNRLDALLTRVTALNQRVGTLASQLAPDTVDPVGTADLGEKLRRVTAHFGRPDDLVIRSLNPGSGAPRMACIYFAGLVREDAVAAQVLAPMSKSRRADVATENGAGVLERLAETTLVPNTVVLNDGTRVSQHLHSGHVLLFVDGVKPVLSCSVTGGEKRLVDDPPSEPTILGARAGFVEDFETNLGLIRREVRSPALRFHTEHVGPQTSSRVSVVWLEGVARRELVEEVVARVAEINPDVVTLGAMSELVGDSPWSIFPTLLPTERVDLVGQSLARGQIAITLENQPFILLAPVTLFDFLKSPDDLNFNFLTGTMLRWVRIIGMILALFAPAMYVAVTTFHHELIPAELLFNVASGREGVPLPPVLEALSMELAVEILREAGSRMPRAIGPAVSIVGVLLLGDAAIQASLVSPLMLVVVGTTVLAQFLLPYPHLVAAVRNIRITFIVIAGFMGLFGLLIALALLITHLVSLRSLGVPYFAPLAPAVPGEVGTALIRAPWWRSVKHPRLWGRGAVRRQTSHDQAARPEDPHAEEQTL